MTTNIFFCQMCGKCCGMIPHTQELWDEVKGKAQKPYNLSKSPFTNVPIWPITQDGYCVFLRNDHTCSIYEQRPNVCKLQGTIPKLPCPNNPLNNPPT
jgi:Fe-S-cluster containining protein